MFYQELYDTCAWGKMYKANLFDGLRYPKGLLFEDFPTTYRLLLKANKVVFNGEQSYFYRLRSNSIERKAFSLQKLDSGLKLLEMINQQKIYYCQSLRVTIAVRLAFFSIFYSKCQRVMCIVRFSKKKFESFDGGYYWMGELERKLV